MVTVTTVVVFFSLLSVGLAIQCFQCNSVEDSGCSDLTVNDTNSQYYKKCDGEYQGHKPFCRKTVTEVLSVKDSVIINRSCGWIQKANLTTTKDFCRKADTDFIKKKQCQCSSDACNESDTVAPSFKWVIVLMTSLAVFKHLYVI